MSNPTKLSELPWTPPEQPLTRREMEQVCARCHHARAAHFGTRGKQCPSRFDRLKPGPGEFLAQHDAPRVPPERPRTEPERDDDEHEQCERWDEVLP